MNRQIIFIQGGGEEGYEADARLVASLGAALGEPFEVRYPQISSDESLSDFGWPEQIGNEISLSEEPVVLVGHSFGASMLLKYLSENELQKEIDGIFIISTPFWSGDEDWVQGLKLRANFADKLPENVPIYFYHCRDDEEVPFTHLTKYRQELPRATFREISSGGHQLNNNLAIVARDIQSL